MTDLFTLADCDRHIQLAKGAIRSVGGFEAQEAAARIDAPRMCATIRALVAELAEQVTHCSGCGGKGSNRVVRQYHDTFEFDEDCERCKPARDLLAKMGVKL